MSLYSDKPKKKKKKRSKPGKRYPLMFYRRMMDRVWGITLILGLVLLAMWYFGYKFTALYRLDWLDTLVLIATIITLFVALFAFFGRYLGYVQANADHLVVRTPLIKLKTPYKRIVGVRSADFHKIFDPEQFSWAELTYLEPFIGDTAVVVLLRDYPLPPYFLKFFFPKFMFYPTETGFVLLVPDWMKFSTELDSRFSTYQQRRTPRPTGMGFQRGRY